jgi:hypothetical protein
MIANGTGTAVYVGFSSDDGSKFKLQNFVFAGGTAHYLSPNTLTMTAYSGGSVVSGSSTTLTAPTTANVGTTWDVSSNTAYQNIDEIRVTTTGNGSIGGRLTITNITVAAAVAPALAPTLTSVSPSSGPTTGGTVATITGTNFTGATSVTIGGTAVTSFYVNNATTITAVTPAGTAGAKSVLVTTSGGTNSANTLFTYNTAVASTVVDFETAATGALATNATSFTSSSKTWTLTGSLIGDGATSLGSSPVGAATPASNGYLDSGLSARSVGSMGFIVAPTGTTFRAVGIDIWPSSSSGTAIIPYSASVTGFPGETGHTFTVKGYLNGSVVVNVNVIDTLRTPPQSGAVQGGWWHHLEFTNSAFDSTDIDKLEIYLNTQSGTAFDGPNSGSALTTPNYIALDNFVYSTLTATTPTITGISPSSGPAVGGTSVVITGTNLSSATGVKFGANSATGLTANTATSITVTAPAGSAGTVDITVTTAGGTSATNAADRFTYVALPTITSINTTSGPTAGGTTVIITGTNLSSATGVKFGTTSATGLTANTATSITVTAPAGSAGTVDITVTTAGGTSATSAADQFTYIPAPTVTSISPAIGPISGGTQVTITGTNFTGVPVVKFGASNAISISLISATQIKVTCPMGSGPGTGGTGVVDITVTTPGGTSATSAADQFTFLGLPSITGISPSTGPASGGTTVVITGKGFTAASDVMIFGYHPSFIVNSDTQITVTTPNVGTTYTTEFVVWDSLGLNRSPSTAADLFTFVGAPFLSALDPTSGPTTGGTSVVITGTNFTNATAVKFGTNNATSFTVNSDTSITAVSSAGSAGTVDITITTPIGGTNTVSAADKFTYVPAPTITSINTSSGPTAGGTTVVITGTNLSAATGVKFGATAATGLTANTATSITVTAPAGSAGTVDVTVTTAGGTSATGAGDHFTYVAAPTVASVSSTKANGSYNATVLVPITVTFSAPVTVTGTPTLALNSGGSASFASGSGTTTLTFNYTVGASDTTSTVLDCSSTSALALAGGTINATTGGTAATLTLPTPGGANSLGLNKAIIIDTTPPTITSITRLTPSGQTTASNVVTFRVTYSEPVTVPGASNFSVVAVNGSNIVGTVTSITGTGTTRDVTVSITSGTGEFRLRGVN